MSTLVKKSAEKVFGGVLSVLSHTSEVCACPMTFAIYEPPQVAVQPVPVLYWLSGLTCTEQNFITKAGAFRAAAAHGVAIVCPDTSPREVTIEGATDSWDFGLGAGFYVNATQPKWAKHFNMDSYVTTELRNIVENNFNVSKEKRSIFGHSMGGHGALVLFLRNPNLYQSVSAFSPICNPSTAPWGIKAFTGYLGSDQNDWKQYDACELLKTYEGPQPEILVDQGSADSFLEQQLNPNALVETCRARSFPLNLRMQEGYSHSYYFISTFIEDHIAHHARYLS